MLILRRCTAIMAALAAVLLGVAWPSRADQVRDDQQPFLNTLDIEQAWHATRGSGVTVAVLDSGVDASQPDLVGQVTTGPDYAKGANPPGVAPKRFHGTMMASIIAGHGHGPGGSAGIIGIAPEARLLSVRVILDNDEPGFNFYNSNEKYADATAKGIRYAADHGAEIINMSLGKPLPSKDEREAIAYAISKGVVVIASAGNQGDSTKEFSRYSYPASYPGVISVAAVDLNHKHAGFSNKNSAVVVSAPGVRVPAEGPDGNYWFVGGTSPAAAFVSGTAALIRSKYPHLAPALVAQAIVSSTSTHPSGGYDAGLGFGEIDATGALQAAGKLSGAKMSGIGLPADRRFVVGQLPAVQVVEHDRSLLAVYSAIATVGLFGLLASLMGFIAWRRKRPTPVLAYPTYDR